MKRLFLILFLFSSLAFSVDEVILDSTLNQTETQVQEDIEKEKKEQERKIEKQRIESIDSYLEELKKIEKQISEKVWIKSYASYVTSVEVRSNLKNIKKRIKTLSKKRKSLSEEDELIALISKQKILTSQIEKLKEKNSAPFSKLITPPVIEDIEAIANPFDIFNGLSLIKTLNTDYDEYKKKENELSSLIKLLTKETDIYRNIIFLDINKEYISMFDEKQKQLDMFETALETMLVTSEVYGKRIDIVKININKGIEKQIYKIINIGIIVLVIFIIFFLLKFVVKRYIVDNERFYMANKIITFANISIIVMVLFFSYIENVSYLVTILGFASAGIAIAMKDWFMSILGWLVIVFGGSLHVGDRIRVDMDGMKYVGDILDISLLRMTILEDITLTAISENRRAGRIIFVPNNYIFSRMIANYSHNSLKTVWDGIKITITFDSNHTKALFIAKKITKKYAQGYTDTTRNQLSKLRDRYSLKHINVEPRIFSFIVENGICIDAWYLTNAYATLTLRSVISLEIVEAFNAEDDIIISYPTQKIHLEAKKEILEEPPRVDI